MTREEALQIIQANAQLLHFEHPHLGIKEAIGVAIEALSKPSLPSDLDEAAIQAHIRLEDGEGLSFLNIFKAGAEWMAGEGETIEGEVVKDIKNNLVVIAKGFSGKEAVFGDKVIVQVRKK